MSKTTSMFRLAVFFTALALFVGAFVRAVVVGGAESFPAEQKAASGRLESPAESSWLNSAEREEPESTEAGRGFDNDRDEFRVDRVSPAMDFWMPGKEFGRKLAFEKETEAAKDVDEI